MRWTSRTWQAYSRLDQVPGVRTLGRVRQGQECRPPERVAADRGAELLTAYGGRVEAALGARLAQHPGPVLGVGLDRAHAAIMAVLPGPATGSGPGQAQPGVHGPLGAEPGQVVGALRRHGQRQVGQRCRPRARAPRGARCRRRAGRRPGSAGARPSPRRASTSPWTMALAPSGGSGESQACSGGDDHLGGQQRERSAAAALAEDHRHASGTRHRSSSSRCSGRSRRRWRPPRPPGDSSAPGVSITVTSGSRSSSASRIARRASRSAAGPIGALSRLPGAVLADQHARLAVEAGQGDDDRRVTLALVGAAQAHGAGRRGRSRSRTPTRPGARVASTESQTGGRRARGGGLAPRRAGGCGAGRPAPRGRGRRARAGPRGGRRRR